MQMRLSVPILLATWLAGCDPDCGSDGQGGAPRPEPTLTSTGKHPTTAAGSSGSGTSTTTETGPGPCPCDCPGGPTFVPNQISAYCLDSAHEGLPCCLLSDGSNVGECSNHECIAP